ncbi:MAG: aminoacetone oxidase family FAD-binding enzyme [Candidatus Cloacimonetes bacterium]|nr:aminoacetone oxidase family FAD-binding enzyme [Candidatus Cloacimonadota bacterium]
MNHTDIIVIGGGPAGLAAAISASRALGNRPGKVTLVEGSSACGNKLLLSGSGQCNFTHHLPVKEFLLRCGEYANYLKPAYYSFTNDAFSSLLAEAGCESTIRADNKVFPQSMKASDVRDALVAQAIKAGVLILTDSKVRDVHKNNDKGFMLDLENGQQLACERLVIASGGASYPQTGSDGKALIFAKALGHKPVQFRSHLNSVSIEHFDKYKTCAGISIPNAQATFIGGGKRTRAVGDLLITHTGFSGPLILDNCHRFSQGMEISVCWVPKGEDLILEMHKMYSNMSILNALWTAPVPKNLLRVILDEHHFDSQTPMYNLGKKNLRELANMLGDCRYKIAMVNGLNTAMASAGGISLTEINAKTMQSRLCTGLYFAGEIMDYALPTGGFNIQMAVSTGWLAGISAAIMKTCLEFMSPLPI